VNFADLCLSEDGDCLTWLYSLLGGRLMSWDIVCPTRVPPIGAIPSVQLLFKLALVLASEVLPATFLLALSRALMPDFFLVVERRSSIRSLLGQWVDSLHVSLKQIVLVFDLVFDHVLKLFHLNLNDDVVHVRVATSPLLEIHLAFSTLVVGLVAHLFEERSFKKECLLLPGHVGVVVSRPGEVKLVDLVRPEVNFRVLLRLQHQEFVHDSEKGFNDCCMLLVL